MPNLLDDLAFKYGADKTPRIKHHYTDVYFDLFKDKRETVKTVVELGVAEGASLRMWKEFFPNAIILGADNDQNRVTKLQEEGFSVYLCDQSSVKDLGDLIENITFDVDLFVDDGSHNPADQLDTCLILMQILKKDCTYIIEDVDDSFADAISSILSVRYDVDVRHVGSRHDDRLIIVRHKQ